MKKEVTAFSRFPHKIGKEVLISFLFLLLIASLSQISAQTNQSTETQKINDAYSCLTDKVRNNCASLSTEEKIFSLLSIGQCRTELISDSSNSGECWPSGNCNLKTTAQSVLALSKRGSNTDSANSWLLSQKKAPSEIEWYLQITTNEQSTCQIEYSGLSYSINLNEDKTLSGNPGPGLSITADGYWLQIFPEFYDVNFQVSCDQGFLTNKLFKSSGSQTIHVFPESSSSTAGGITNEKVESFCFAQNNVCNYEGSLWAALALDAEGEEVSSYLPYLITLAENNQRHIPDSFLYAITGNTDYRTSLLSKQIGGKWWAASSEGRFYDTSLALYPLQHDTLAEKSGSKQWLLDEQNADGCWDSGNLRNTAFVLLSAWPRSGLSPGGGSATTLCEPSGNYCVPSGSCDGNIISGQSCSGISSVCCTVPYIEQTCSDLGGDLCSSNEVCERGNLVGSSDASGVSCCVGDICKPRSSPTPTVSQCESSGGACRAGGCLGNEDTSSYLCSSSGETCCISQPESESSNYLLIWILLALIILAVLGVVFRDQLRHFLLRIKSKFRKSDFNTQNPQGRFPPSVGSPGPSYYPPRRPNVERRILPRHSPRPSHPAPRPPERRPTKSGASKELDDVLKKLKEMGK
ncbi:MAG: hypothetical protein Q8P81_02530 [Nanoarchaeota archaeon]|nr:hypothetical protein [Nanoarchaeota archaeon]